MKLRINVIAMLLDHSGLSIEECAKKSGLGASTIKSWLNGKRNASGKNIKKLAMGLRVKVDEIVDYDSDLEKSAIHGDKFAQDVMGMEINTEKITESIMNFPVISEAAAVEASGSCYYPIGSWAEEYAEEKVSFSDGKPGDFVIRVTGSSMLPWYPAGTLILVRPNAIVTNGERVVVVLEDGSMLFKIFAEKGDEIHLFSVNEEAGKDFHFKKNAGRGIRIFPVIQSMRNEHALDKAMAAKGIRHNWQDKLDKL